MSFSDYVLENYSHDLTKLESLITNYDAINAATISTPVLNKEIEQINFQLDNNKDKQVTDILAHYRDNLIKEMESRFYGNKAKMEISIKCIKESCSLNKRDAAIFESLDIYPDSIDSDISRIDRLIESYIKKIPEAGMLIGCLFPTVISIAKYNDSLLTENMCNIPQIIADKITQENYCENIVEYNTILKEAYNQLYYSWDKNRDSGTYKILKGTNQLCKELDQYITESVKDIDSVNHENIIYGKLRECYTNIAIDREIPLSDNALFEEVIRMGRYLEILEEEIKNAKASGAQSKQWQRNNKIQKKARNFYDKTRQKVDASDRNKAPLKDAIETTQKALVYKIEKIITMDKQQRRQQILEGGFRNKVFSVIRRVVTSGLLYILGGRVLALVGFLGSIIADTAIDSVIRKQIIHEFETELKIVEEKISDAKSAGKRREKYQLMRLKAKMEKELANAKYSKKFSARTDRDIV